jgi:N-acetylglucosaminyldiphosphoundecaprenol N-acetyl-beta-D-mannosaminyltransferase
MISSQSSYMGYNLFSGDLNNLPTLPQINISTINQYSFCIAEQDKDFKKALQDSDVLLPDGIGIVLAVKATSGQAIKKISGADMLVKEKFRSDLIHSNTMISGLQKS